MQPPNSQHPARYSRNFASSWFRANRFCSLEHTKSEHPSSMPSSFGGWLWWLLKRPWKRLVPHPKTYKVTQPSSSNSTGSSFIPVLLMILSINCSLQTQTSLCLVNHSVVHFAFIFLGFWWHFFCVLSLLIIMLSCWEWGDGEDKLPEVILCAVVWNRIRVT